MGADLGAAAGLIALAVITGLITLIRRRQARLRRELEARAETERKTTQAIVRVARGHAADLSSEDRALARAWFLEQWVKYGNESNKQRLMELQ